VSNTKFIVERGGDITTSYGEAGRGVYAYVPNNAMRKYYTAHDETLHKIMLNKDRIVDLSTGRNLDNLIQFIRQEIERMAQTMQGYVRPKVNNSNAQRFGRIIEIYVRNNYPNVDAYIVKHMGPGIPTGKQVVITNMSVLFPEQDADTTAGDRDAESTPEKRKTTTRRNKNKNYRKNQICLRGMK